MYNNIFSNNLNDDLDRAALEINEKKNKINNTAMNDFTNQSKELVKGINYLSEPANTKFLPQETPFKDRRRYIINGWTEQKRCSCGCGGFIKNTEHEYLPAHGNKSDVVKEKKRQSYKNRTGFDNPSQNPEVKQAKK